MVRGVIVSESTGGRAYFSTDPALDSSEVMSRMIRPPVLARKSLTSSRAVADGA